MEEEAEVEFVVMLGPGQGMYWLYLPRGWIHQAETVSRPTIVIVHIEHAAVCRIRSALVAFDNQCHSELVMG